VCTCVAHNAMQCGKDVTFYYEPFSVFQRRRPRVPLCNRDFISERVASFVTALRSSAGEAYLGPLSCAVINDRRSSDVDGDADADAELLVCDGQHRFLALRDCYMTHGIDAGVPFFIKRCADDAALRAYYRDLNNVFISQDLVLEETDLVILERFKAHLRAAFGKHVTHAERPRFPNVNADALAALLLQQLPAKPRTYAALREHADALNVHIGAVLKASRPALYAAAVKKQGFFLAYLFAKTEHDFAHTSVPKAVRNAVWERAFPASSRGTCGACSRAIDVFNFHAGHIVAAACGGTATVDNLTPLCACCNTSMGTTNFHDFKARFFGGTIVACTV
jgi:hypothetical protein